MKVLSIVLDYLSFLPPSLLCDRSVMISGVY